LGTPATLNSGVSMYIALARASGTTTNSLVYTSTSVQQMTAIPDAFSLQQNYPNPFNPTTNVEFRITNAGFVSMKVFDALGREVASLVNEVKSPGTYIAKWDASQFNSGVYFCRLQSGSMMETKKMMLVK
jgi:hypothetical protein